MSESADWQPKETAPKDRPILVYGQPSDVGDEVKFLRPGVYAAYWDSIDSAFCIKGGTWLGPFIDPMCWMEEPKAPKLVVSLSPAKD